MEETELELPKKKMELDFHYLYSGFGQSDLHGQLLSVRKIENKEKHFFLLVQ